MVAKRRKFDTRTILIILLVIVIIGAAYIVITNLPPEDDTLSPEEVIRNPSKYLEQTIIVRGYYFVSDGNPVIVSTLSDIEDKDKLIIDYSAVNNATDILISGADHIYKFTGVLTLDENVPLGNVVIFKVEKIVKV